ncbi:MAG: hypothetical protein J1F35_06640 [Erysipelotrichales bacterium]|nr:hypothetical protein [Erysipelotrichales bacterium]
MKTISEFLLERLELEKIYNNILNSFNLTYQLNESEGLFKDCEELADYILSLFTKGVSYGKFKMNSPEVFSYQNTITKEDFRKLFCDKLRCDFYISKKYHSIHAVTHSGENINKGNPDVIGIFLPTKKISLYELKGAIIHELLHYYGAQMMFNIDSKNNYFDTTKFKSFYLQYQNLDDALLGDLIYEIQKNELNSFAGMLKTEIDKLQKDDPNEAFKSLQETKIFKEIISLYLFFKENKKYNKDKLEKSRYKNIINIYRDSKEIIDRKNCNDKDYQLYSDLKSKIFKAYSKFTEVIGKMCSKYANKEQIKYRKYSQEEINLSSFNENYIVDYFDEWSEFVYENLF